MYCVDMNVVMVFVSVILCVYVVILDQVVHMRENKMKMRMKKKKMMMMMMMKEEEKNVKVICMFVCVDMDTDEKRDVKDMTVFDSKKMRMMMKMRKMVQWL